MVKFKVGQRENGSFSKSGQRGSHLREWLLSSTWRRWEHKLCTRRKVILCRGESRIWKVRKSTELEQREWGARNRRWAQRGDMTFLRLGYKAMVRLSVCWCYLEPWPCWCPQWVDVDRDEKGASDTPWLTAWERTEAARSLRRPGQWGGRHQWSPSEGRVSRNMGWLAVSTAGGWSRMGTDVIKVSNMEVTGNPRLWWCWEMVTACWKSSQPFEKGLCLSLICILGFRWGRAGLLLMSMH